MFKFVCVDLSSYMAPAENKLIQTICFPTFLWAAIYGCVLYNLLKAVFVLLFKLDILLICEAPAIVICHPV